MGSLCSTLSMEAGVALHNSFLRSNTALGHEETVTVQSAEGKDRSTRTRVRIIANLYECHLKHPSRALRLSIFSASIYYLGMAHENQECPVART